MSSIELNMTLGNNIYNGLLGTVSNIMSINSNSYDLRVNGSNSVYGIFES